ncbi:MAG: hypothetical protein ABI267_07880, partial [Ginsengibacter sp.]
MEENKNHIDEMQKLADEGWKQMHETLRQHGLSSDAQALSTSSKKRNVFLLIAACIFFFLVFTYPFILNDSSYFSSDKKTNTQNSVQKKSRAETKSGNKISLEDNESPMLISHQKHFLRQKINAELLQSQEKFFGQTLENEKKYLLEKFSMETALQIAIPKSDKPIDTTIKIEKTISLQKKSANSFSKKMKLYAGAGINISSADNKSSNSFNFRNFNIHPSVTLIIPLTQKLNIHTGLSAFSTIHGKEVTAKEKELVNNLSSNVYYNIKTT